jgi:hypothetical protein
MKIRRAVSMSSSLPAISEDGNSVGSRDSVAPAIPARSLKRNVGPPRLSVLESPPSYWEDDNSINAGKDAEKASRWRDEIINNRHVAKRGGWMRFCLIALVVLSCIAGLVIGLVFGLKKGQHTAQVIPHPNLKSNINKSSSNHNPSSINTGAAAKFPVGNYSINTFLSNVTTDCTSNSNTWLCYPFSTYSQSQSASAATFDWIVSVDPEDSKNYTISSTPNYFSIMFANLTLFLRAADTPNEHYFFSTVMRKPTRPTTQIGSSNVAATCYFNSTTLQGYLYTRMPKTYPNTSTDSGNESGAFASWPYAVSVEQTATSGSGTPTCLDRNGNSMGDFSAREQNEQCSCKYLNTGT